MPIFTLKFSLLCHMTATRAQARQWLTDHQAQHLSTPRRAKQGWHDHSNYALQSTIHRFKQRYRHSTTVEIVVHNRGTLHEQTRQEPIIY